jgi:hypothetical protein
MPDRLPIRLRRAPRDPDRFPADDPDTLGRALWERLIEALGKGRARPALVVFQPDQVEQFDLSMLLKVGGAAAPRLVAALAARIDGERQTAVECAGVVGTLRLRRPGREPAAAGVVFLEWPDGAWWTAHAPLAAEGGVQWPEPAVRSAVDGWPRPGGLGGWFARARRERLVIHLSPRTEEPTDPALVQQGMGLVH